MATKRHSKTWEQQAKYYEVDNIADYMIETYLNGNIQYIVSYTMNSNPQGENFSSVGYSIRKSTPPRLKK